jgi:hypothetical protein
LIDKLKKWKKRVKFKHSISNKSFTWS